MCVSELTFFFPLLWCGTKKKTGGSLEDGRMEGGVSLSHGQLGSSSAGGNLYGGGGVGAPRSTTSSSSSQSPPATGPIAISSGSAASGKMAAPTSNGGGGRKYQCKMCPQVGPIPIILILFIPLFSFFFPFRSHFFWLALFRLSPFGFQHSLHVPPNRKKQREKKNSSFSSSINTRTTLPVVRRNKTTTRLIHSAYQQKVFLLSQWEAER